VLQRRLGMQLGQAELAVRCGVSQQTISKIEKGVKVPFDDLKLQLARALDTSPDLLFPWPADLDAILGPQPAGQQQ